MNPGPQARIMVYERPLPSKNPGCAIADSNQLNLLKKYGEGTNWGDKNGEGQTALYYQIFY